MVIQLDGGHGANQTRNDGFQLCDTELVLFSDDDIDWDPQALEHLVACLDAHPEASYAYPSYSLGNSTRVFSAFPFDAGQLRKMNYISTMAVIRAADFPGFDPAIPRLQDWDLWLAMLDKGKNGVWSGKASFRTEIRQGLTFGNPVTWEEAVAIVKGKWGLT